MIKLLSSYVNVSSSFPIRSRCGKCKDDEYYCYYDHLPMYFHNPRSEFLMMEWYKKYFKRVSSGFNLDYQPRKELMSILNYEHPGRAYKPRAHVIKGCHAVDKKVYVVSCVCGDCVWVFSNPLITDQKEIVNRKAKYSYPKKYYNW